MNENIQSPIAGGKAIFLESFSVPEIASLYAQDNHINVVSNFNGLKEVALYQCVETGYRFFHPSYIAGDGAFYSELNGKNRGYYNIRWEHQIALNFLSPGDLSLEVGCGDGSFIFSAGKKGHSIVGLELNDQEVKQMQSKGLAAFNMSIADFAEENARKFQNVMAFQVLEHMTDIAGFFKSVNKLLKPGGSLIIAVPNNNPYIYYFDRMHTLNLPPHHMGWWNLKSLQKSCKLYGFQIKQHFISKLVDKEVVYIVQLRSQMPGFLGICCKFYLKLHRRLPLVLVNMLNQYFWFKVLKGRDICIICTKQ